MQELVLDLGIGQGGRYLTQTDNIARVGLDLNREKLEEVLAEYWQESPHLIQGNTFDYLPFRDQVFDRAQIYFPYVMFYGLIKPDYCLWSELNRVLKNDGSVDIVFDVYHTISKRRVKEIVAPNLQIRDYIFHPVEKVIAVSELFGFCTEEKKVSPLQIQQELGTYFSQRLFRNSQKESAYDVVKLTAQKKVSFFLIGA